MPQKKHDRDDDKEGFFAVIDIGSNSVRLVVYDGLRRHPQVVFNEKVLCGLGRSVGREGRMDEAATAAALRTLERFALLLRNMKVARIEAVATAAVREASNGEDFVRLIKSKTGLRVRIIPGREEARLSALGVLSGIPEANGIVGDLGGGSLELVEVANGAIAERVTLPIGPVRLEGQFGGNAGAIARHVKATLRSVPWLKDGKDKSFYIVGGAWRAVSRANMAQQRSPLPILHGFSLEGERALTLAKLIAKQHAEGLAGIEGISSQRLATLPIAALILQHILARMKPARVVTSSLGLREGLIFDHLDERTRREDPFIAAAREMATISGRFPEHGDRLMAWIDPVFAELGEDARLVRLRLGACLLSDISWRGHPDFRAERAVMEALYGRFVGVDHRDRGHIGLILNQVYGASDQTPLAKLCRALVTEEEARLARIAGAALRLGHRLSGGTGRLLKRSRLEMDKDHLTLRIDEGYDSLVNEVVERRLAALAGLLSRPPRIVLDKDGL